MKKDEKAKNGKEKKLDKVNKAKAALEDTLKTDNYDEIKAKTEDLKKALEEIGSSLYGAASQGQQGGEGPSDGAPGPDGQQGPDGTESGTGATDADFKVK